MENNIAIDIFVSFINAIDNIYCETEEWQLYKADFYGFSSLLAGVEVLSNLTDLSEFQPVTEYNQPIFKGLSVVGIAWALAGSVIFFCSAINAW